MTAVPDIASATAARLNMFPSGGPVLLMVSGGGDSVALLELVARGAFGEHPLRVLHVNHQLRGPDAEADEAFVRELAASREIDARIVRYDVGSYAEEHGLNLEDAGRRIRYRFAEEELDALCEATGKHRLLGRIAVAHTLDDRVETFFMRAISGCGTGALASIAAVRGRIVRPLIECERSAVRAWLEAEGVAWREDATNDDTARARAFVRANIVPAAEMLNPAARTNLARTMDLIADDDRLLDSMAEAFSHDFAEAEPGRVRFARDMMRTLDRTMARRTVRLALSQAFPDAGRLEAMHIESLVDGMTDDAYARDLPGGIRASTEYDSMVVSCIDVLNLTVAPGLLPVPGIADVGDAGRVVASFAKPGDMSGDNDTVVIDLGKARGELTVDAPRAGDRIRPLGMEGTRKLSDLLIDAKVPKRLRQAVPVVRDGEHIVWVAGLRMSEDYRVTESSERTVRLTWERGDTNR